MDELVVLKSALKHGLSEESINAAWSGFVRKRPRGDDCWVSIGFDAKGRQIEMVGLVLANGTILIIHAMSPATEKMLRELGLGR